MGLILDSTVFIDAEHRGQTVVMTLERLAKRFKDVEVAISAVTAAELFHGIWRARRVGTFRPDLGRRPHYGATRPVLPRPQQVEQQRLQQQARELADESRRFFERIAIPTGAHVVEIGCGPQGCLRLLANRVGPTGTDHGNGKATGLPRASFDLATARLVLVNIPEPEDVVGRWHLRS